jgi:hypothetical protein
MGEITLPKELTYDHKTLPKPVAAQMRIKLTAQLPPWPVKPPSPATLEQTSVSLEGQTPRYRTPTPLEGMAPLG